MHGSKGNVFEDGRKPAAVEGRDIPIVESLKRTTRVVSDTDCRIIGRYSQAAMKVESHTSKPLSEKTKTNEF